MLPEYTLYISIPNVHGENVKEYVHMHLTSKVSPNHPQMLPSDGKSTDKVAAKRTEMIQSACSACEVEQSVWLQMLMRE